jgi:uncharacterized protein YndB with AHSA1/START domain
MKGPDGGVSDNPGCFLEIVPMEKIVSTSALVAGYRPNKPWLSMTAVITMADEGDGTRYIARVMHPDEATRKQHEELGFYEGWDTCITQLDEFAQQLK